MAQLIAKHAHEQGLIGSDQVSEFSSKELAKSAGHSHAALAFGGNARENTVRARELLGWQPFRLSIFDEVPVAVATAAARLRMTKEY
jgi:hypothetical protein